MNIPCNEMGLWMNHVRLAEGAGKQRKRDWGWVSLKGGRKFRWMDGWTDKLTDLGRTVIQKLHHVLQDLSPSGPPLKRKCCLLCSLALAVIRNWFYVVFCDLSMTRFDLEKGKNRLKTKTARKTQDGERQTGWQTSRQTDRDWQNWRETNRAP